MTQAAPGAPLTFSPPVASTALWGDFYCRGGEAVLVANEGEAGGSGYWPSVVVSRCAASGCNDSTMAFKKAVSQDPLVAPRRSSTCARWSSRESSYSCGALQRVVSACDSARPSTERFVGSVLWRWDLSPSEKRTSPDVFPSPSRSLRSGVNARILSEKTLERSFRVTGNVGDYAARWVSTRTLDQLSRDAFGVSRRRSTRTWSRGAASTRAYGSLDRRHRRELGVLRGDPFRRSSFAFRLDGERFSSTDLGVMTCPKSAMTKRRHISNVEGDGSSGALGARPARDGANEA